MLTLDLSLPGSSQLSDLLLWIALQVDPRAQADSERGLQPLPCSLGSPLTRGSFARHFMFFSLLLKTHSGDRHPVPLLRDFLGGPRRLISSMRATASSSWERKRAKCSWVTEGRRQAEDKAHGLVLSYRNSGSLDPRLCAKAPDPPQKRQSVCRPVSWSLG